MPVKDLSLNDVLTSKVYVKPNSSISFGTPKDYIGPFVDMFKEIPDFRVKVTDPVINAEDTGVRNIAYPRIMVEADLGEGIEGFRSVVGMVYALDLQKPVMKIYSGYNASGCINLTIFNTDNLAQQELLGDYKKLYEKAGGFIENKVDEALEFKETLTKLQTTFLNESQLNQYLGKMIREASKLRLGTTPIMQAAKLLDDNSSVYYVKPDGKFQCSKFNLYNSVTQSITNSNDIIDRAVKTIQVSQLILN